MTGPARQRHRPWGWARPARCLRHQIGNYDTGIPSTARRHSSAAHSPGAGSGAGVAAAAGYGQMQIGAVKTERKKHGGCRTAPSVLFTVTKCVGNAHLAGQCCTTQRTGRKTGLRGRSVMQSGSNSGSSSAQASSAAASCSGLASASLAARRQPPACT